MAHNPKLNIYIIELRKRDKSSNCSFFDYYNTLSTDDLIISDKQNVFEFFMNSFTNFIGGAEKFSEDDFSKKVFGIDSLDGQLNLKIDINNFNLSGILEGGKYGIERQSANIRNKEERKDIPTTDAILDKFYFLIHTPLNSKYGYLIIQSYTEETILGPFLDKLSGFFYLKPEVYFSPKLELYVPKKFIEKYQNEAFIRDIKFTSKVISKEAYGQNELGIDLKEFEIVVTLKPKGKIKPDKKSSIIDKICKWKFNSQKLEEFEEGKVYVQDDGKKKANFDISQDLSTIKPTIYLEDTEVKINKNGIPEYESIHKYCISLLKEVDKEFKKSMKI